MIHIRVDIFIATMLTHNSERLYIINHIQAGNGVHKMRVDVIYDSKNTSDVLEKYPSVFFTDTIVVSAAEFNHWLDIGKQMKEIRDER